MLSPGNESLPAHVGKYRVRAKLGAGGMADVYLAYLEGPAGFTKPVALKRMKPALARVDEFVDLFLTEAKTASLLAHPNICQVYELGAGADDGYFMVMEYLLGVPLTKLLAKQIADPSTFPLGMLVGLAAQACEGMHYAHNLCDPRGAPYNIIHRDLSPPNIYMTKNGMAKILDFGISKSTQSVVKTAKGQIRGKFSYMSPEQLRGHDLDPRSDVFSLAIIVLELLTGTRLFRRASRLETFEAVTRAPIPRADAINKLVPSSVADALELGLSRDRDARFSSARAFGTALSEAAQGFGGAWTAPQIAEYSESIYQTEMRARQKLLDAAQSEAFNASEVMQAFEALESTDRTIADDCFSPEDAETKLVTKENGERHRTQVDSE
ncbi:MAG: serine/threonine protein kinase [Myxococcales bacterium]|nr:serine/threonine protein kinase [Myxococcales bacterium]